MSHTLDSAAIHPLSAPSRSPWGWLALGVLGTSTVVLAALNVVQWRSHGDAPALPSASLSAPADPASAQALATTPLTAPPVAPAVTARTSPAAAPRPTAPVAAQKPALARVSTHGSATKTVASSSPAVTPEDENPAAWQRERERGTPTNNPAQPSAPPATAARTCHQCGTVESITPITQEGQASGIGAVAGGLLGGLLGNQVGGGEGKTLATMAGVVGGAWAGNTVEKRMKPHTSYRVSVRMDDGSLRSIEQASPSVGVGSRVQVQGSVLSPVRD